MKDEKETGSEEMQGKGNPPCISTRKYLNGKMAEEKKSQNNPAMEKAFAFAVRIIKLYQHLSDDKKEFILSKQILRSGTSIGANIEESQGGTDPGGFSGENFRCLQRSKGNVLLASPFAGVGIDYGKTVQKHSQRLFGADPHFGSNAVDYAQSIENNRRSRSRRAEEIRKIS